MATYSINGNKKEVNKMNKDLKQLLIIWGVVILSGIFLFVFIDYSIANAIDGKYDAPCTGHETAGRCADKCPEGSYLIGFEHDGSAVCKLEPTGCPYGDSIPLGPQCDKQAPAASVKPMPEVPVARPIEQAPANDGFVGK